MALQGEVGGRHASWLFWQNELSTALGKQFVAALGGMAVTQLTRLWFESWPWTTYIDRNLSWFSQPLQANTRVIT